MSNLNPPAAGRGPRWLIGFGWAALAVYALFLARNFSPVAGGADSSGYLNSARLLATGELTTPLRAPPEFGPTENLKRYQFQPHGFAPFPGNPHLSPTYAVGLPLHLAVAGKLLGWERAPVVVGVAGALAAVLLCYALGRRLGLDPLLAATGATLLAAYPVFVFMSIQPLSDTLATTWCLAAMYAALRARAHRGWAVATGAAFAIAVLVRATNVLLLPALIVLLGLDARRLTLMILGGLPGALWLGYYNHALYGGAFRSGYVNLAEAFHGSYAWPTLLHFAQWLALMLPAAVLVLPFAAAARRDSRGSLLVALAAWFGAFTGLYACYEVSREVWWDLRFILPATPALILGALLGVDALARGRSARSAPRVRGVAAAVLSLWAIGLGWFWTAKFHLLLTKTYEQAYADASAAAVAEFPADALVVAAQHSGALYYYTDFPVLRWDLVDPAEFERFRARAEAAGRPVCAVLFHVEEQEALQKCPGAWTKLTTLRNTTLWKLETPPSPTAAK